MNNEITPIDLITQINDIKDDLEILSELTDKKILKENSLYYKLESLSNNLQYNINDLNDKVKNVINNQIQVLSISIKDTINEVKKDLLNTTKAELEKDINYKLNILENEFKKTYKTIFDNTLNDLKLLNNNLNNNKSLNILEKYSESIIKQQKEIILKQDEINAMLNNKLDIFSYIMSLKWFISPLFYTVFGIILAVLINKYILIDYFNYYQSEKTTTAIKEQNKLIEDQQVTIVNQEKQLTKFMQYNIAIHEQDNKVYLRVKKNNYKNNLIDNRNKDYSFIELIK